MCQRTKTTSAAAAAPTILSILCPTGKRSSHCSEAAAAVAAVSISFGSRVTTQLEKGSRRKEGRKKGYERKGNSEFRPVGSPVGPNSKSRISLRRKSLPSVEEYSSQNCNQHVSGGQQQRTTVRPACIRITRNDMPAVRPSVPSSLLPSATNCHVPQFQSVASSASGAAFTLLYIWLTERRRTGTVLTASPTTRRPT